MQVKSAHKAVEVPTQDLAKMAIADASGKVVKWVLQSSSMRRDHALD